jgi:hypothetical protein
MDLSLQESHQLVHIECFDDTPIGDVMGYLMIEGLVESESDARLMIKSMSEEWFEQLVIESDDYKVKKLPRRNMRKGEGLNNYAGRGKIQKKSSASETDTGRTTGGDGKGMAGKGKYANNTPWTGAGSGKSSSNDTKKDDKRIRDYNKQARADRRAAAKERAAERS